MKSIEESVVTSMDGTDNYLFPFIPYILQDIWEIGSSPEIIISLIKKHAKNYSNLKILDLGCGKGAVSIQIAKEFNCYCYGIDAIKEFVSEAQNRAKEYKVETNCFFEVDDIRTRIEIMKDFDIIILGSIGPVFGNYFSTLSTLKKSIKRNGLIIIDDGYIEDGSNFTHPLIEKKSKIFEHISAARMKLIDEVIITQEEIKESDDYIFKHLKKRCQELIKKEPSKSNLFLDYIKKQEQENEVLEQRVICSTMVIGAG